MLSRALLVLMALFCRVAFAGGNRPRPGSFRVSVGLLYSREDKNAYALLKRSLEDHTPKNSNYTFDIQRALYEGKEDIAEKVCDLFSRGVKAIVATSPTWPRDTPYEQLSNLSKQYHVPFITYPSYDYDNKPSPFILTIKPSTVRASLNMMLYYGWKYVIFLRDQRSEIEAAMLKREMDGYNFSVLNFSEFHTSDDAVEEILTLQEGYKKEEELRVILLTTPALSKEIVTAYAKQRIKKRVHFLLVEPYIVDDWMNSFEDKRLKVTRFNLVDTQSSKYEVLKSVVDASSEDSLLSVEAGAMLGAAFHRFYQRNPAAFATEEDVWIDFRPCSSDIPPVPSVHGLGLSFDIKKNKGVEGYSGNLQFDSRGKRRNYVLHVMETTSEGDEETATWSDRNGLRMTFQVSFPGQPVTEYNEPAEERYIITSILEAPYLSKHGNRYVGFCKELLNHLSTRMKFKYSLKLVGDSRYGHYNGRTGKWNGMIGEITDGVADMAVAPLMITSRRSLAVDFTAPFQNHGIVLLMKDIKESTCMSDLVFCPFTWQLWVFIFFVYVAFGVLAAILYRYTNSLKYQNRHDAPLWSNRLWPLRVLLLVFLVFTIMIVSIYIASLGTVLSHQRMTWSSKHPDFKDVFRQSVLTGTPKILLVRDGRISAFFQKSKDPLYRRYWSQVSADSSHFVSSYHEGIQRVIESNGDTAISIGAASGEYLSKNNCDLKITKGAVDVKSYAIALRLNHPLRQSLNEAILSLRENGTLDYLYEKWWKSKCPNNHDTENDEFHAKLIQLREVGALFYMLAVGFSLVALTTVIHLFYWKLRVSSQSESHTILYREQNLEQDDSPVKTHSLLSCVKRIDVDKS